MMKCKITGCLTYAQLGSTRCRKHQRAFLKRTRAGPLPKIGSTHGGFLDPASGRAIMDNTSDTSVARARLYKEAAAIIRTTLTAELTLTEAERREHIAERLEAL